MTTTSFTTIQKEFPILNVFKSKDDILLHIENTRA